MVFAAGNRAFRESAAGRTAQRQLLQSLPVYFSQALNLPAVRLLMWSKSAGLKGIDVARSLRIGRILYLWL